MLSVFLIIAILVGVLWYLIVDLILIFLMTNDFEHLFMCSLPKGTFKSKWKYKSFFKSVKNKLKVELILLSVVKIVTGGLNRLND